MDAELSYIDAGSNVAVTVDMFQGKVVKKASTANWQAAYPSDKSK